MEIKQVNNLPNEDYHNSEKYKEYWSSSNLKKYIDTPREAYYQKYIAKPKENNAMYFGSCLHDWLESKHVTGKTFDWNIFEPPTNPSTGKYYGKDTQKYKGALSDIVNPISADDMESIESIWRMIKSSGYSWYFEKEIMSKGIAEPSFFVEAGIHKYKYRADVLTDDVIFDYKTITKDHFYNNRHLVIKDRGYDISASMYQFFEHKRTGIWKPFYIIWIMKDPPYDILIEPISQYCFEIFGDNDPIVNSGAMTFLKLKDQHELCQVAENWPGLANQFQKFRGLRLAETTPRFERGFDEFEID